MRFNGNYFEKKLFNKKVKNIGIYWSWDKNYAEPHWGYANGNKEFIFQALIVKSF